MHSRSKFLGVVITRIKKIKIYQYYTTVIINIIYYTATFSKYATSIEIGRGPIFSPEQNTSVYSSVHWSVLDSNEIILLFLVDQAEK